MTLFISSLQVSFKTYPLFTLSCHFHWNELQYFLALTQVCLGKSVLPGIVKYIFFPLVPTGSAPQHARVSCTSHGRRSCEHFWYAGNQQDCFKYYKFLSESDYPGRGKLDTRIHMHNVTYNYTFYLFSVTFDLFLVEAISNLVPENLSLIHF